MRRRQDSVGVIATVGETSGAWHVVEQLLRNRGFVLLSGSNTQTERLSVEIDDGMNLRREAATRTAEGILRSAAAPTRSILVRANYGGVENAADFVLRKRCEVDEDAKPAPSRAAQLRKRL